MTDPFLAWMMDRGIYRWVRHVQGELSQIEARVMTGVTHGRDMSPLVDAERQRVFAELMRIPLVEIYGGDGPVPVTIEADGTRTTVGEDEQP